MLFSSDLKDEPFRGLKYCQNKKYQVFLVNFGQPVYKKQNFYIFNGSLVNISNITRLSWNQFRYFQCNKVFARGLQCLVLIFPHGNLEVQRCIHKGSSMIPIQSQFFILTPVSSSYIFKMSSDLYIGLLSGLFPISLPLKISYLLLFWLITLPILIF